MYRWRRTDQSCFCEVLFCEATPPLRNFCEKEVSLPAQRHLPRQFHHNARSWRGARLEKHLYLQQSPDSLIGNEPGRILLSSKRINNCVFKEAWWFRRYDLVAIDRTLLVNFQH